MGLKNKYILFLLTISILTNAQKHSVSGYITDKETRETIIGAAVVVEDNKQSAVTDINGYFQITGLDNGTYTFLISHISYETQRIEIKIEGKNLILKETQLSPKSHQLMEVSVIAARPDQVGDRDVEISHIEITPKAIKSIPRAGNDIFSAIKYLPGIEGTEPFSPLFSARGSDPGENAILLDGVMIYNPYHSLNNSGIFNMLTIKNVDLLVGGFGAEYGGRNSSVLHLTTKDGNLNELHGEFEPSTFQSKAFLEFPAGKNASMMVAGRYYYDLVSNFMFNSNSYFYDFNLSYTNRLNDRNRLTIKYFQSKDKTGVNFNTFYRYIGKTFNTDIYNEFDMRILNNWVNRAGTAILKTIITPKLFLRSQVYISSHKSDNLSSLDFNFDIEEDGEIFSFQWKANSIFNSEINDLGAKTGLNYMLASFTELNAGIEYNSYTFKNGTSINDIDNGTIKLTPDLLAIYIEDKLTLGPFIFRPGVRLSNYCSTEWLAEPRINAVVNLSDELKLKLAWGEYYQYIISMNTSEIELNQVVDYYYPLRDTLPSKSIHYIAGLEHKITPKLIASLDVYYKDISRIYTFDLSQNLKAEEIFSFSNKLEQGKGEAYGLELLLRGEHKKLSGWMSYSLAWSYRSDFAHIKDGGRYVYDYNRKHAFKAFINYQVTPRVSYSGTLTYLSGLVKTIESTMQSYYYYDPVNNEINYFPFYVSNSKNNARMPAIIYLDFSIIKKLNRGFAKKLSDYLHAEGSYAKITINNVLFFRRNVIWYYPVSGENRYIPLGDNYIPSLGFSYAIKF